MISKFLEVGGIHPLVQVQVFQQIIQVLLIDKEIFMMDLNQRLFQLAF